MAVLLIPVGELLVEGAIALGEAIAANAAPAVVTTATVATVASLKGDSSAKPATAGADSTTVKGKPKMNCGEDGKYGDLQKKTGDNKYDRDHIPSKASLQQAARDILAKDPSLARQLSKAGRDALFGDNGLISKSGLAVAIPKADHRNFSPTYGQNDPKEIAKDAKDLQGAAKRDTKAMKDAQGKEMDPECFEKYKEVADKIDKITNEQYDKALKDVINKAIEDY